MPNEYMSFAVPATPKIRTRFAPSPTGRLHAGHGFSALAAYEFAVRRGGALVLRIEDIDEARCKPEFESAILEDLAWLGLVWEEPVRRQSDHFADYEAAIASLTAKGLTYPCFCTRKDIQAEINQAMAAPHEAHGPDGPHYPGICRRLSKGERAAKLEANTPFALRLDIQKAAALLEKQKALPLTFSQLSALEGPQQEQIIEVDPLLFGDIVLARKDIPTSYHVSVVFDDHLQGITHIIRGEDLAEATHIQRVLQALWDFSAPKYFHHPLVTDEAGRRLAKRDKDETLDALRKKGVSAQTIGAGKGSTSR